MVCSYVNRYYFNPDYTQLLQLITAFVIGLLFGPFAYSLIFYVSFIILYEILYLLVTKATAPWFTIQSRAAIILAGIGGWIVGRIFARPEKNPLRI